MSTSDGSTAEYYQLPPGSTELQHLISHRDMNAQIGEIFRACYRYGIASHSSRLRDAKKIRFYIEAEIARLEALSAANLVHDYGHTIVVEEPRVPSPLREQFIGALDAMQEPASQIDDSSARRQAIEQNGNDGLVYEDPWYGAPEWAMFKAQDEDGQWHWYEQPVTQDSNQWLEQDAEGRIERYKTDKPNPNWRDTLIERTSGQDPQE